ncbi:MAG: PQQ-binding-like beta-propeller repeat protein [Pirellulaceae bacterium]
MPPALEDNGPEDNEDWNGWRGSRRDGLVTWLPDQLPGKEAILWTKRMSSGVLGGVAATRECVIVADRDPADRVDIFRCLNADGSDRWTLRYLAPGQLDYGNSPRATAVVLEDLAILSGAQGHLHAVELASGKIRWKKHFPADFGDPGKLAWGYCSSPLWTGGKLIINPGGPQASLVALEPASGNVVWKTPGRPPGHGSLVAATLAGRQQIVGYDDTTLGGWDVATGERLWTLKPRRPGDFNVPTPLVWRNKLIVATENNGARMYGFDVAGRIQPEAEAENLRLVPDCQSPVLVGNRLFGVANGLYCLNVEDGLSEVWRSKDRAFREYGSLIASSERILVTTLQGQLLLLRADGDVFTKISELQLWDDEAGLYSHPAIVGNRLYVRGSQSLVCLELR